MAVSAASIMAPQWESTGDGNFQQVVLFQPFRLYSSFSGNLTHRYGNCRATVSPGSPLCPVLNLVYYPDNLTEDGKSSTTITGNTDATFIFNIN